MSDPQAIQAAALAAVDRLIEREKLPSTELVHRYLPLDTAMTHLADVGFDRIATLEGRRRIIQRHAPERRSVRLLFSDTMQVDEWICARCLTRWEDCADWRDAAAGLPLDQILTGE